MSRFSKLEKYLEAIDLFDQAMNIDPGHVGCLYNRGIVLEKLGKIAEAAEFKDRAKTIALITSRVRWD